MVTQNLGIVKAIHVGAVAPTNLNMVWRDTSVAPELTKVWNTVTMVWDTIAVLPMPIDLDMGANDITNVVLVDGRDVAADGAILDTLDALAFLATVDTAQIDNLAVTYSKFDTNMQNMLNYFSGIALDQVDVVVSSDGATIIATVEQDGGGDIRLCFTDGVTVWDTTPAKTVALTAGTDSAFQINFVYFLKSSGLLAVSTSAWPTAEHHRIATVLCQTAATLQTEGAHKVHAWMDHVFDSDGVGHQGHINSWVRAQMATWISGVVLTPDITINGGAEDNVDIDTTSGIIRQLHEHGFPLFDTGVASDVYIPNKFGDNFAKIQDLNAANEDDAGVAITNNRWTNLVIWGAVNNDTADCKLYVNLPGGFHSTASAATVDAERFSNFTIPTDFTGVGFLIARLTLKFATAASGTWTLEENLDLRAAGATGGSGVQSNEFFDTLFKLLNTTDSTKKVLFDVSAVTTGTERTIDVPDKDFELIGIEDVPAEFGVAISDESSDLTTGAAKITFRMPYAMTLQEVRSNVNTAPTGATLIIDINESGASVLSTKLSIDIGEKTSETAGTPPVISDSALADDAEMTIDIDQIGSTVAGKGGKVWFKGIRT